MANVEEIRIDSDERGFELHMIVDDDCCPDNQGRIILNIHGVAEELWDECVKHIGPWLLEAKEAKAEYDRAKGHPLCPDEDGRCQYGRDETCPRIDEGPWPGESVMDYYQRTGQDEPLREVADAMNKARKEA